MTQLARRMDKILEELRFLQRDLKDFSEYASWDENVGLKEKHEFLWKSHKELIQLVIDLLGKVDNK